MTENSELRNRSKTLYGNQNWIEAIAAYEQIYTPDCDKWIAWEYSRCLKYADKIDKAIEISKRLYQREKDFEYNNNHLAWMVYEKFFKTQKNTYELCELQKLYETTIFVSNLNLGNKKDASRKIIIKMIKLLKNHGNNPYEKILTLLDKIDVSTLSDEIGVFTKNNRKQEYQSEQEMYFAVKSKALFKCKKYEACIVCCDEALEHINNFHHDNNIWILSYKAQSLCELNRVSEALEILKDLVIQKEHFKLFDTLANMYLTLGDNQQYINYLYRAALTNAPADSKVNLYFKIATFLFDAGEYEKSAEHVIFTENLRLEKGWNVPNNLQMLSNRIQQYKSKGKPKLYQLKNFWISKLHENMEVQTGIVLKINSNGKTGFIKTNTQSYFFKTSSVVGSMKIREKATVKFVLTDSYDNRKKHYRKECSYILIDKYK